MAARTALLFFFLTSILVVPPPPVARALAQDQGRRASDDRGRDFDRDVREQAETDAKWRAASDGYMQMQKITYRSRVGDLDVPAFVFQPLRARGPKGHAAIVWVHENIRSEEHTSELQSHSDLVC